MEYTDYIYGKCKITEPVILEIINSPSLQRLKGIDQAGYKPFWAKFYVNTDNDNNRFAHSVGVFLLLQKYNASLKEQIAGLIHDVSHSAFSHCIDYVLDKGSEKEQNHQDNLFNDFVRKTEIPDIIRKYGFDLEYILNDKNFPLEEKNLPDLCADRIDYSLRTAIIFGEIDNIDKNYFLENLTVENNNWIFENFESAKKFAELFLKLNTEYFAGFLSAVMFKTVGDYLRYALQKKYINEDDLYATDEIVLLKVGKYLDKDEHLSLLFKRMNKKINFQNNPKNYDAQIFCKSRIVDPLCKYKKETKRISEIDASWSKILKKELKPKQYFIKFER